ncbi:SPX domain-containing protein 4-like isoform X2 [Amaranthus tricolor]|uniref:SPX domain-containing protein 4-like isoform X2 n=1 Tax=Amaranthus tricolor TaxID=29722 RepID=UPI00259080E7|nr:SPX domain-containing protein 4-like isoform X2 [Amaranthus tricolor]
MKFGKEFRIYLEDSLPEWRDKFLCYKPLKKLLKRFPNNPISVLHFNTQIQHPTQDLNQQINGDSSGCEPSGSGIGNQSGPSERFMSLDEFQDWFVRLLNNELDKLNDFYVEKEEDFIIRFQELKERIVRVRENRTEGVTASETEFSEEMMEIRKEFVTIHGEMVLLKNYSSLNFAGLVKILKKYDKRTGGLLRLPFTQLAAHQPFFTTEPLTRLVRECEANLELLFPLEEEVTESTSAHRDQNRTNIPPDASSLEDTTHDIYRSTLSAIRTIQGLRTSSTYNPLSLAVTFRDQDDEGNGAVTAENSPANCNHAQVPLENEDTIDQDGHSS